MKPETETPRPLNPETEVAMPLGPIPLLQRYQQTVGVPLRKLSPTDAVTLERTGDRWHWSWSPEQVAMFLADWESQFYIASPLLRELALTKDPMGGGFIYERFCRTAIVEAIRKVQVMYDKPLGKLRPVPKGTFTVDLTSHPAGMRATKFRINDWEFFGRVTGITEKMRNTLAYMHGRWMEQGRDMMNPKDHPTTDLGRV